MTTEKRPDGWTLETFDGTGDTFATRNAPRQDDCELSVAAIGGLDVSMSGGYGYETWSGSAFVPWDVLRAVLAGAGFELVATSERIRWAKEVTYMHHTHGRLCDWACARCVDELHPGHSDRSHCVADYTCPYHEAIDAVNAAAVAEKPETTP